MQLLIVGATGLVGSQVLQQALADSRITRVVAPVRRALPAHPKLLSPLVDFEQLPEDAAWWHADALVCTLGTTIRTAGSQQAFRRVDHDYPLQAARLARRHGTPAYVLNSAMGADAQSRIFYNRVKGDLERDLQDEGFASLTFVRPGLISGPRSEHRPGERALVSVLGLLGPLLPRRLRLNPAHRIALALVDAALRAEPGIHAVGPAALAE